MKYPLRNIVYEALKEEKNVIDKDLLSRLVRDGEDVSMRDINKVLLQLEILGLITVRWVGKDKRRIEVIEDAAGGEIAQPSE
jgi:Fe2+ or Zn2+ uptake regulation protein